MIRKAEEMRPGNGEILFQKAIALRQTGDRVKAKELYEKIIGLGPLFTVEKCGSLDEAHFGVRMHS